MKVTVKMEGLDELRAALKQLPEDLTAEAAAIVQAHANMARSEVSNGYPVGPTGNLKNRVTVTHNIGRRFGAVAIMKSAAPHSSIFERGTVVRHTKRGANRGRMPQAPEAQRAIPKIVRIRRRMYEQLIALVRSHGLRVDTP